MTSKKLYHPTSIHNIIMKNAIIRKNDGKYQLFIDDNYIIDITKKKKEGNGDISLILPDLEELKEYQRYIREKNIIDGEDYQLKLKGERSICSSSSSSSKTKTSNWLSMATPEELKIIDEIKEKCIKRLNDPQFIAQEKLRKMLEDYKNRFGVDYQG